MDTLSTFSSKLNADALSQKDIRIIGFLMQLINQRRIELAKQQYKEQPVYWYSRMGR